ncbi:hypothetical protein ACFQ4C_27030 [Larkinella insperata]|uniref:DUF3575 domain-containing protein n=1 Tax=Larkinella insperata TaxID=332158 RepID=A0ABW3QKE4_9BACT|nr:hypothetical protein [Larkinella insperata]
MKTSFLLTITVFVGMGIGRAQAVNNAPVAYSQEDSAVTVSELKRVYRYITRANVEEKTLIKLGFWPNTGDRDYTGRPSFRIGLNADVSIERKITPSFSLLAGGDFMLRYNRFNQFAVPFYNGSDFTDIDETFRAFVYAKVGVRYYYSMAKNIRKGKGANNFSGNYAGLQVARIIFNQANNHTYDTRTGQTVRNIRINGIGTYDFPVAYPHWGVQRRIGRLGFIDVNAGPEMTLPQKKDSDPIFNGGVYFFKKYHKPTVSLRVNAVIGLGW